MASIEDLIQEDPNRAIWLITGKEALLVDRAVGAIIDAVSPGCGPSFNISSVRLSDGGGPDALGTANTLPMMAERRLVVVRELEKGDNAFFDALLRYLDNPSPSTTLVVCGSGYPKVVKGGKNWSAKVNKAAKAAGIVHKFSDRDVDPVRFAMQHATSLGHQLGSREARLLVELVGSDLGIVAREVEKASLFVARGDAIDGQAVEQACSLVAEAEVWDLTAGVVARDPNKALAALHRLLEEGEASRRLVALVVWQIRSVLRVAELTRRRMPDRQIQSELRLRPQVYARIRRLLSAGFPGAAVVMSRLARANRAMNSHRAGDRRVLEDLVIEFSVGRV